MPLAPGTTFARFGIVEPLGRGGMAAVYKAYERELDRYVALKILPAPPSPDDTFARWFHDEARIVARLEHPHIVPVYGFGVDEGTPWMSMRLLSGGTLAQRIAARKTQRQTFAAAEVAALLRGAAVALDHAHQSGVVHRDVTPGNIIYDDADHTYLTDFGIATIAMEAATRVTGVVTTASAGTPTYMAPEQATGTGIDGRSDVYGLGVIAYEMLTGAVPFTGPTPIAVLLKHQSEPVPIPPANVVPPAVFETVANCLEKDPAHRYRTATAFVDALAAADRSRTATTVFTRKDAAVDAADDASTAADAPRAKKRRRLAISISISISFVALAIAVLVTRFQAPREQVAVAAPPVAPSTPLTPGALPSAATGQAFADAAPPQLSQAETARVLADRLAKTQPARASVARNASTPPVPSRDGAVASAVPAAPAPVAAPRATPVPPVAPPPPRTNAWFDPYDRGRTAVREERWDDAIAALTRAIAIDPHSQASKVIEGVFRADYFPQYYLFIAYLKTNRIEEARRSYDARGELPASLDSDARAYARQLVEAEAARRKPR